MVEKCDGKDTVDISLKVRVLGLHDDIPITLSPASAVKSLKGRVQGSKADLETTRQRLIFCGRSRQISPEHVKEFVKAPWGSKLGRVVRCGSTLRVVQKSILR